MVTLRLLRLFPPQAGPPVILRAAVGPASPGDGGGAPEMILLTIPLLFLLCGEGQGRSLIPHVTAPEKWRLGFPEKVLVRTSQQLESFPVTVSLVSYPDKKTTFSSTLLALTPDNRFRGALKLSVEAEDSPGEFVYLVVESEVFREDRRIPVTSAARTTMDEHDISALRRKRQQSLLTAPQLRGMTNRYQNPKIQQCCLDGSTQYSQHENCKSQHSEELKRRKPHCYRAYEECCIYTEEHMVKSVPLSSLIETPTIIRESFLIRRFEEPITITVTQSSAGSEETTTFTVKVDPTQNVSIQLSSTVFHTKVDVLFRNLPPADGDQ
ncbi:uncharacterized protein LOC143805466 isoform X2 [Ranitomeya variabilis]|uniref:uncharacterized protein LOC143805466 isoform X2 n=1 Tax=Ranitomeya variabilis TaxID=490064 RepID=UPI004056431C